MLKGVPTLIVVDGEDPQASKAGEAALNSHGSLLSKRVSLKDFAKENTNTSNQSFDMAQIFLGQEWQSKKRFDVNALKSATATLKPGSSVHVTAFVIRILDTNSGDWTSILVRM